LTPARPVNTCRTTNVAGAGSVPAKDRGLKRLKGDVIMRIIAAVILATIIAVPAFAQSFGRDPGAGINTASGQKSVNQVHRRAKGASARAPAGGSNVDPNYWYERNRDEFRGRW
jgi:hypothetical protein